MARHILDEIGTLVPLGCELAFRVETALHEAIANVTLHGALEAPGFDRTSLESLKSQQKLLDERLADPGYAGREVEVRFSLANDRIEIDISGPGPGFDVDNISARTAPAELTRGLSLIANLSDIVTYRNGGRAVALVFFLPVGAPDNDPAGNSCGGQT